MFVGFSAIIEIISLILRHHHNLWSARNFDIYSEPMDISGFLMCHTYFDKGHLQVPVKLNSIAERLAVELSLSVIMTKEW